jgi:transcriptional regulator NrdR family protein
MNCLNCGHTYTKVLDTRIFQEQARWMKRRRKCIECGHIFFTLEMPVEDVNIEEPTTADDSDDSE